MRRFLFIEIPSFLAATLAVSCALSPALAQTQSGTKLNVERGSSTPPAKAASTEPPAMKPVPQLTDEQMERFLKTAPITSRKSSGEGTTGSLRVTLSDGKLTHDAQIQCIDIFKPVWHGAEGTVEKNFRDTWKFNVAAYRLGRLIGFRNIPMSVEREFDGKLCAASWWVDNVWMDEAQRRDKGIKPPETDDWVNQLNEVRVFDQLIYNTDRNQGNLLITPEWKIWMIDHTRAFRTYPALMKVEPLKRVSQSTLQALRNLTAAAVQSSAGPWLRAEEINAVMARRDLIVKFFESEIRSKGEDSVLTGIPRKTPAVSVP